MCGKTPNIEYRGSPSCAQCPPVSITYRFRDFSCVPPDDNEKWWRLELTLCFCVVRLAELTLCQKTLRLWLRVYSYRMYVHKGRECHDMTAALFGAIMESGERVGELILIASSTDAEFVTDLR